MATAEWENASIVAVSLKTGQRKTLLSGGYFGRYIPGSGANGHLVYIHEGTLFSVPFDAARLELLGTSTPLLEDVAGDPGTGAGQFDFSQTGTFLYRQGKAADQTYPVVWMDSSGTTKPLLSAPGVYTTPRFSPDGKRLGLSLNSAKGRDLYVYDWQRDTMTRLTFTSQGHYYPTWMPDGKHLAFRSSSSAGYWIGWVRADGAGEPQRLVEAKGVVVPYSFSPDGRYLAYSELRPEAGYDLWMLPLDLKDPDHPKPGKPELFLRTPFDEYHPAFSPDGRWVAYQSNESGRHEVYVRPFPASSGAGRWQISTAGGGDPVWSREGKQLFFATIPAGHIMVTDYTAAGDSFVPGKPRLWSNQRIRPVAPFSMDPAPDGKRFAVFPVQEVKEDIGSLHVTFLLNYFDLFRRSVSTGK